MALEKRANSKFWYSVFTLNNKRYIKSTRTVNKTLAAKLDREWYDQAVKESFLGGKEIELHKAIDMYLSTLKGTSSYKTYVHTAKWLKENCDNIKLHKIDTAWMHKLAHTRGETSKPATVRNTISIVNCAIKYCSKMGYDVDPKLESPRLKIKNIKTRILTEEEIQKILNELDPNKTRQGLGPHKKAMVQDLRDFFIAALELGGRISEIANIKWDDIDLEKRTVKIWRDKTKSASLLPISNKLYDVLINRDKKCDWIFPNQEMTGPRAYSWSAFKSACVRAGCPDVSYHTLRHTFISRLTMKGLSIPKLQKMSGHSDIGSLKRYMHLSEQEVVDEVRDLLDS